MGSSRITTVMTERTEPGPSANMNAVTRASEPDVKIIALPWWQMIGVRVARNYLQGLLGFLTAGAMGIDDALGVPMSAFGNAFVASASLAVAPAVVCLIQNALEILTKIDITQPQIRA